MKAKLIFTTAHNIYEFISIGQGVKDAPMDAPRNMYLNINGRAVLCGDSPHGLAAGVVEFIETLRGPLCDHTYNTFLNDEQRGELTEIYNELKRYGGHE